MVDWIPLYPSTELRHLPRILELLRGQSTTLTSQDTRLEDGMDDIIENPLDTNTSQDFTDEPSPKKAKIETSNTVNEDNLDPEAAVLEFLSAVRETEDMAVVLGKIANRSQSEDFLESLSKHLLTLQFTKLVDCAIQHPVLEEAGFKLCLAIITLIGESQEIQAKNIEEAFLLLLNAYPQRKQSLLAHLLNFTRGLDVLMALVENYKLNKEEKRDCLLRSLQEDSQSLDYLVLYERLVDSVYPEMFTDDLLISQLFKRIAKNGESAERCLKTAKFVVKILTKLETIDDSVTKLIIEDFVEKNKTFLKKKMEKILENLDNE